MKKYLSLLVTLFLSVSVCAQSMSGAYKVKSLEGEALLINNKTTRTLAIGDVVGLSDTIKLKSGSKMTILQLAKPNKIFKFVDNTPTTVYRIIQSAANNSSSFNELIKSVVKHNKKDGKKRISQPYQSNRGVGDFGADFDKYVYSIIATTVDRLTNRQIVKGHTDVAIERIWMDDNEFSFKLYKNNSEAQYINVVYIDAKGNFGFCFDENLHIDGKLKKDISLPIAFDASKENLQFLVVAAPQVFDVAVVQRLIKKHETALPIYTDSDDAVVAVSIERVSTK